MKKIGLLTVVLLCCASLAVAQLPGSIGVFADAAGQSCQIFDVGGVGFLYVIHMWTSGATASEFKVNIPPCVSWLADNSPFPLKSGNFKDGTSIPYQSCRNHPIELGYMIVNFTGICPPCSYVSVVENPFSLPPPNPGEIYVVDCRIVDPQLMIGTGDELVVNPSAGCQCDIPVEDTTWGQVKALFE